MKNLCYFLLFILLAPGIASAQSGGDVSSAIVKVEAKPAAGFAYPYYLYVPKALREAAQGGKKKTHTILVIPNNAGELGDDFSVHEEDVKRKFKQNVQIVDRLGVALLTPVFPRPQTDWKIYTHALDRDAMTTAKKAFARFDLQLIAMIDDARARLAGEKLKFDQRVLLLGFAEAGNFMR